MANAHDHEAGSHKLRQYLDEHRIDATLIAPGAEMPTVPLAAAALGITPGEIVKTIVFVEKRGAGRAAIAVTTGDVRVHPARVATALGLGSLKLAPADRVLQVTGYAAGGVPPVGHATIAPIVVDERVLHHAIVYGGGGDELNMLRIAPADIVRATGAVVTDIVSPPADGAKP